MAPTLRACFAAFLASSSQRKVGIWSCLSLLTEKRSKMHRFCPFFRRSAGTARGSPTRRSLRAAQFVWYRRLTKQAVPADTPLNILLSNAELNLGEHLVPRLRPNCIMFVRYFR